MSTQTLQRTSKNQPRRVCQFHPPYPNHPQRTCSLVCHPPPARPRKGVPLPPLAPAVTPDPSRQLWVLQRRRRPWSNIGVFRWFNDHGISYRYIIAYHGISWYIMVYPPKVANDSNDAIIILGDHDDLDHSRCSDWTFPCPGLSSMRGPPNVLVISGEAPRDVHRPGNEQA